MSAKRSHQNIQKMTRDFAHKRLTQCIALGLSVSLLWTSGGLAEAALDVPHLAHPAYPPQIELAPPAALGAVVDYFNSTAKDSKRVILIQDLHAHYGVQKNIAGILDFLTAKLSKSRSRLQAAGSRENTAAPSRTWSLEPGAPPLPFLLAVEGAAGPIDSSAMSLFPDAKIKEATADYLMREGEL